MRATARYVCWRHGDMWLKYFEQFPGYLTQGDTLSELEENLDDLYEDVHRREITGIRGSNELSME